jgi:hypothetical protein
LGKGALLFFKKFSDKKTSTKYKEILFELQMHVTENPEGRCIFFLQNSGK